MTYFDVFNGDADGICALHQLRLAEPRNSQLITGVKRDIALLERVNVEAGDSVTVLDISLDKNRDNLNRILADGASVFYADHHFAGDIPEHEKLSTHINTDAQACTGLIINELLGGAYRPWAVTAAFGDNLLSTAQEAATPLNYSEQQLSKLQTLGTLLNYNGYGSQLSDLYYPPDSLYQRVQPHSDPFAFIEEDEAFVTLQNGYSDDHQRASSIKAEQSDRNTAIFVFPNAAYARRISGVFANELAQNNPDRAHALLSELDDGSYLVSVRAPINRRTGADELCRQFETGGGRKAAAGINRLPASDFARFVSSMAEQFKST
ncbi:MAG: acetyltransferase [Granulosicoccus sp.]|nr:acetyltransferase [Granulosicoccus sp.]